MMYPEPKKRCAGTLKKIFRSQNMKVIHESEVPEKAVPGRFLCWIVGPKSAGLESVGLAPYGLQSAGLQSAECVSCVMRVEPGSTVQPAHSHPDCEELIYIVNGSGHVYVDGLISAVREGSAVLFEKDSVHMVRNSGKEEMKVVCFFSEATDLSKYQFHKDVDFDRGKPL
jgi:quercetin dioxygenase-like cupin family protein